MRIIDVARKANVSPATISRAINTPHVVAPERLARIRAAMSELNYEPAPPDRRRGPKKHLPPTRRIGIWFSGAKTDHAGFDWFRHEIDRVQSGSPRHRIELSFIYTSSPDEFPPGISENTLDGLILQGLEPSQEVSARLHKIPRVWFMTRRSTGFRGDFVEPDNEANGRMAADYLRSRGHTSVAVVTAEPGYSAIARRVGAFKERCLKLGLAVHCVLGKSHEGMGFLDLPPASEEMLALVRRYLAIKPTAGGLYIPSDYFCGMIFRSLRQAGMRPGRDFEAVLGHYNPEIYHNLDYSPAALDINLATLVRTVIDHLIWRIENPGCTGRIGLTVSPTLILPSGGKPAPAPKADSRG